MFLDFNDGFRFGASTRSYTIREKVVSSNGEGGDDQEAALPETEQELEVGPLLLLLLLVLLEPDQLQHNAKQAHSQHRLHCGGVPSEEATPEQGGLPQGRRGHQSR